MRGSWYTVEVPRHLPSECLVAMLLTACLAVPERDFTSSAEMDATPGLAADASQASLDGPSPSPDGAPDAQGDAAPDIGPDVGPDAEPDVGPDAAPDAGPDAAPDVGPDAAPDVGPDAGPPTPWTPARCPPEPDASREHVFWVATARGLESYPLRPGPRAALVAYHQALRFALHPNGVRAAVIDEDDIARVDLVGGAVLDQRHGATPRTLGLSLDGAYAVVAAEGNRTDVLAVADLAEGDMVDQNPGVAGTQHKPIARIPPSVLVATDNRVFVGDGPGVVLEYTGLPVLRAGRRAEVCPGRDTEGPLTMTADGRFIAVAADGYIGSVSLSEPPVVGECHSVVRPDLRTRMYGMAALPGGRDVVVVLGIAEERFGIDVVRVDPVDGTVRWRTRLEELRAPPDESEGHRIAFHADRGRVLVLSPGEDRVHVLEADGGELLPSVELEEPAVDLATRRVPSEALNELDDDCDGQVDEGLMPVEPDPPGPLRLSEAGFRASWPDVAADGEDLLATWVEMMDDGVRLRIQRRDAELTVVASEALDFGGGRLSRPMIAPSRTDDGTVAVAWLEHDGRDTRAKFQIFDQNLNPTSPVMTPGVGVAVGVRPTVSYIVGEWHVCYARGAQRTLTCTVYPDRGGPGMSVPLGVMGVHALAAVRTPRTLRLAWRTNLAGLAIGATDDRGLPTHLMPTGSGVQVAIAPGAEPDRHVLLHEAGDPTEIQLTPLDDMLGAAERISSGDAVAFDPHIARAGALMAATWTHRGREMPSVVLSWSRDDGALVADEEIIGPGQQPRVAGYEERAVVGWIATDDAGEEAAWILERSPPD